MIRLRLPLLVVAVLIIQQTVLNGLRVHGVHPDAMILLPIAAGLTAGPETGAAVGFVVGIIADLFVDTPFGLSALVYGLVGFFLGFLSASLAGSAWWVPPFTATVATAAGTALYALLGAVVGQSQMLHHNLAWIVGVVSLFNGVLAGPVVWAMAWALPEPARVRSL